VNALTRRRMLAQDKVAGRRTFEYCLAQGLDLALVGYMASGAFVSILNYPHLWILAGLSVGLYTTCSGKQVADASGITRPADMQFAPIRGVPVAKTRDSRLQHVFTKWGARGE